MKAPYPMQLAHTMQKGLVGTEAPAQMMQGVRQKLGSFLPMKLRKQPQSNPSGLTSLYVKNEHYLYRKI
jgi:hypothetical protein